MVLTYAIIAAILVVAELIYFRIADHFNIIDKPNERSSHSNIVLRGGGIIFPIGVWIWYIWLMVLGEWFMVQEYCPLMIAVTMAAAVSFVDDIHPLSDSVRLVNQFVAMLLVFYQIGLLQPELWWLAIPGILLCVGAVNLINFTDGINGMIAMEAIACMVPSIIVVRQLQCMEESLLWVAILSVLVIILGVLMYLKEAKENEPKVVMVDEHNRIVADIGREKANQTNTDAMTKAKRC